MIVTTIGSRSTNYSMEEAKGMNLSEYIRGKRDTMEITDKRVFPGICTFHAGKE